MNWQILEFEDRLHEKEGEIENSVTSHYPNSSGEGPAAKLQHRRNSVTVTEARTLYIVERREKEEAGENQPLLVYPNRNFVFPPVNLHKLRGEPSQN